MFFSRVSFLIFLLVCSFSWVWGQDVQEQPLSSSPDVFSVDRTEKENADAPSQGHGLENGRKSIVAHVKPDIQSMDPSRHSDHRDANVQNSGKSGMFTPDDSSLKHVFYELYLRCKGLFKYIANKDGGYLSELGTPILQYFTSKLPNGLFSTMDGFYNPTSMNKAIIKGIIACLGFTVLMAVIKSVYDKLGTSEITCKMCACVECECDDCKETLSCSCSHGTEKNLSNPYNRSLLKAKSAPEKIASTGRQVKLEGQSSDEIKAVRFDKLTTEERDLPNKPRQPRNVKPSKVEKVETCIEFKVANSEIPTRSVGQMDMKESNTEANETISIKVNSEINIIEEYITDVQMIASCEGVSNVENESDKQRCKNIPKQKTMFTRSMARNEYIMDNGKIEDAVLENKYYESNNEIKPISIIRNGKTEVNNEKALYISGESNADDNEDVKINSLDQSCGESSTLNVLKKCPKQHDLAILKSASSIGDHESESEISEISSLTQCQHGKLDMDRSVFESKLVADNSESSIRTQEETNSSHADELADLHRQIEEHELTNEINNESLAVSDLQLHYTKNQVEVNAHKYDTENKVVGSSPSSTVIEVENCVTGDSRGLKIKLTEENLDVSIKKIVSSIFTKALGIIDREHMEKEIGAIYSTEDIDLDAGEQGDEELRMCFVGSKTDAHYEHEKAKMNADNYKNIIKNSGRDIITPQEVENQLLQLSDKPRVHDDDSSSESSYDSYDALSRNCSTTSYESYYSSSSYYSDSCYSCDCSNTSCCCSYSDYSGTTCSRHTSSCSDSECYDHGDWSSDDSYSDSYYDSYSDSYDSYDSWTESDSYYDGSSDSDYDGYRERRSLRDLPKKKVKHCNETFARNSDFDLADRGLMRKTDGTIVKIPKKGGKMNKRGEGKPKKMMDTVINMLGM